MAASTFKNERPIRDAVGGDKLYRNDGGIFVDVSEEAGIYGSVIGFGLGVTVGDIDGDNWPDIFISNDFSREITSTSISRTVLSKKI